jgi:lysozyme
MHKGALGKPGALFVGICDFAQNKFPKPSLLRRGLFYDNLQEADPMPTLAPGSAGKALIKHFEGCAKKQPDGTFAAYPDPATGGDPWTIGWGATGADIVKDLVWTQAQCDKRFETDIALFAKRLAGLLTTGTTGKHQFDALLGFAYNVGVTNLRGSTLLRRHLAGETAAAKAEFHKWNKAAGKVMTGLTKRRAAEAELYGTPDDEAAPKLK